MRPDHLSQLFEARQHLNLLMADLRKRKIFTKATP